MAITKQVQLIFSDLSKNSYKVWKAELHDDGRVISRFGALCDFGAKPYFDICLDDKAGFEAEKDWEGIYNTLKELGEIKDTF